LVAEAGHHLIEQADRLVGVAQQQGPASEVMAPPSNAATTRRPSKPSKSN
jgi:hypothetical protein